VYSTFYKGLYKFAPEKLLLMASGNATLY